MKMGMKINSCRRYTGFSFQFAMAAVLAIQVDGQFCKIGTVKIHPFRADAVVGSPLEVLCSVGPPYNSSHLVFELEFQKGRTQEIKSEDNLTAAINETSMRLRYEKLPTDFTNKIKYITCYNKERSDTCFDSMGLNVRETHKEPLISRIVFHNWETIHFEIKTREYQTKHFPMHYEVWYKGAADNGTDFRKGDVVDRTQGVIRNPIGLNSTNDELFVRIKVNGSVQTRFSNGILETITSDAAGKLIDLNRVLKPAKVSNIGVFQNESNNILMFQPPKLNRNITYNITIACNDGAFYKSRNITRQVDAPDREPSILNFEGNGTILSDTSSSLLIEEDLGELPPFTVCVVGVKAVSVLGGYWSELETHQFETLQKVPLANPKMCASCFHVIPKSNDTADVIMYFDSLSKEVARGRVIRYRMRISLKIEGKESIEFLNQTNATSFRWRNLSGRAQYKVGIEAETNRGYNGSLNLTYLYFTGYPRMRYPNVSSIFKVLVLNKTAARASWNVKLYELRHVYLFWCERKLESKECSNALSWAQFFNSSGSEVIFAPERKVIREFIFGIGIERNGGDSSGIMWTDCTYEINDNPPKPRVKSTSTTASEVTIFLEDPTCEAFGERGLTVGYEVMICPVAKIDDVRTEDCLNDTKTLIFNRSEGEVTLRGLEQHQFYQVSIQSLTESNRYSGSKEALVVGDTGRSDSSAVFEEKMKHFGVVSGAIIAALLAVVAVIKCRTIANRKFGNVAIVVPKAPALPGLEESPKINYKQFDVTHLPEQESIHIENIAVENDTPSSSDKITEEFHSATPCVDGAVLWLQNAASLSNSDSGLESLTPTTILPPLNAFSLLGRSEPGNHLQSTCFNLESEADIERIDLQLQHDESITVYAACLPNTLASANVAKQSSNFLAARRSSASQLNSGSIQGEETQLIHGSGYAFGTRHTPFPILPVPPGRAQSITFQEYSDSEDSTVAY